MWWSAQMLRMLVWRSKQPAAIRYLESAGLFSIALLFRFALGPMHGAIPFLTFYPAILLAALLFGWKEAAFVLALSLIAGWYFFLPPTMSLLPAGWAFLGILNIAIIIALKGLAQGLAEAKDRQAVLFQELQHRVANTLQSTAGRLEVIAIRMTSRPTEAADMLDEAIQRMYQSAEMHRRLNDPNLFSGGLRQMVQEVVNSIVDQPSVSRTFQVDEMNLSLNQMSVLAMLVIEVSNNSVKHVFQRNLGSRFDVTLVSLPGNRAMLKINDDGPGGAGTSDEASRDQRLGMRILQGLAAQINGTLTVRHNGGTEVVVEFPPSRDAAGRANRGGRGLAAGTEH